MGLLPEDLALLLAGQALVPGSNLEDGARDAMGSIRKLSSRKAMAEASFRRIRVAERLYGRKFLLLDAARLLRDLAEWEGGASDEEREEERGT